MLALIQPWIIWIWRNYFKKGELKFYETGKVEIGLINVGPVIGIHGTLRTIDREFFVKTMIVKVTRLKDNSSHEFQWSLFRPYQIFLGTTEGPYEIPSSFLILNNFIHRLNIQFTDLDFQEELNGKLAGIKNKWREFLSEKGILEKLSSSGSGQQPSPEVPEITEDILKEFSSKPFYSQTYNWITENSYWRGGNYKLKIKVISDNKNDYLEKDWYVVLTEEDEKRLRLNAVNILQESYFNRGWKYDYIYKDYLSELS